MYREETYTRPKPIGEVMDLFGRSYAVSKKTGRPLTERQTLTKYFCDRAYDRKGPIVPARMGFILQGLDIKTLYYMKSVCESDSARVWENCEKQPTSKEKWNKLFWGMLKPKQQ